MDLAASARAQVTEHEEDQRGPLWLGLARTFVDQRCRDATEISELMKRHLPKRVKNWNRDENDNWTFEFDDLLLEVVKSEPEAFQAQVTSWTMPRSHLDPLRQRLRHDLSLALAFTYATKELAMALLRLVEDLDMALHEWESTTLGDSDNKMKIGHVWFHKPLVASNSSGADTGTAQAREEILGVSIKSACENIPSEYRIRHVEPVFRSDLVSEFQRRRTELEYELSRIPHEMLRECVRSQPIPIDSRLGTMNIKELVKELSKPKTVFHGTHEYNVHSIVEHGFVIPGGKAGGTRVEIECGATFGVGVCTSPDPTYSLMYADTARMRKKSLRDIWKSEDDVDDSGYPQD